MPKTAPDLETMRHSASHVMAQAVVALFPGTKLAIGPAIDDGFYYDFDCPHQFVPEDLPRIENRMREIVAAQQKFSRVVRPKEEAHKILESAGEKLKIELLDGIADATVSFYENGPFSDMCRGPHVAHTGEIGPFKLTSIAGAYWRGDETRPMLQRIYGVAFATAVELEAHLKMLEEAKARDHRKLGAELGLFSIDNATGPGLVLWHPKGARVRLAIEDWLKAEATRRGYEWIFTPHIAQLSLWQTSGHADFFRENMFEPIEVEKAAYQLKPMNCPFHILIYKSRLHSYRELPLRLAELGTVYRYERSGVLHGLLRVRGFTQDDAHIFCAPETIESEVDGCIDFALAALKTFGFEKYAVELSTWDPQKSGQYSGAAADWERAQKALETVLQRRDIAFSVKQGEAAFYGPKIDFKLIDAIGRSWQLTTIQFDFNLPEKFDLEYVAEGGERRRPFMVHRALLGSLERFFGILIENYAGKFPLWLSPVQVKILTLTDAQAEPARALAQRLQAAGLRVELDLRPEKVGAKVRDASLEKVPVMVILGPRDVAAGLLCVRLRDGRQLNGVREDEVVAKLKSEISERRLTSAL